MSYVAKHYTEEKWKGYDSEKTWIYLAVSVFSKQNLELIGENQNYRMKKYVYFY